MLSIEAQIQRYQLTSRNHARLMRDINRRNGERHATERVPNHFEASAYSMYGARPRDPKYNRRKLKMRSVGHTRPNVKSGRLRKSIVTRYKVTATQYGSRVILRGTVKSPLRDWQRREIAVVSREEIRTERKRQASEYRSGATGKYKRKRKRRV